MLFHPFQDVFGEHRVMKKTGLKRNIGMRKNKCENVHEKETKKKTGRYQHILDFTLPTASLYYYSQPLQISDSEFGFR